MQSNKIKLPNPRRKRVRPTNRRNRRLRGIINQEARQIQQIHDKIENLEIGQITKRRTTSRLPLRMGSSTPYLESLLMPESAFDSKVPGMADATIPLRRKLTYNLTANASGACAVIWQPYLSDNNANLSTFFINNSVGFDGISNNGTNPVAITPTLSINAATVAEWRLVSASMHIVPQSSVLNQSGTIHGALTKCNVQAMVAAAGVMTSNNLIGLYPQYQNTPYYNAASVSNMEGLRIIWVPGDDCLLEFMKSNLNAYTIDGDSTVCNTIVATIVGAAASAPFRVDVYLNYEVTAFTASVLQGMESVCPYNMLPTPIWRSVFVDHRDDIVIAARAISDIRTVRLMNEETRTKKLGIDNVVKTPTFNNPYKIEGSKFQYLSS
jgi:hypothetical protein